MNRVRYLAMRQRPTSSESRPLLVRRLFSWKTSVTDDYVIADPQQVSKPAAATNRLPDEAFVALAAVQQFSPRYFITGTSGKLNSDEQKLLNDAESKHQAKFGSFDLMQFRKRFWKCRPTWKCVELVARADLTIHQLLYHAIACIESFRKFFRLVAATLGHVGFAATPAANNRREFFDDLACGNFISQII
jgi:hypothetical protein